MHYFLLGSSVMALIYLSAEENVHLFQKPRFVGVKTGRTVTIYCVPSNPTLSIHVKWYKGELYKKQLKNSHKIKIIEKSDKVNASITIKKVEIEDSGTYFCQLNRTLGPGTELQVSRYSDPQTILRRSRVKDVIIFLQAILLVLCVVVPLVQIYKLEQKEDAIYEEPEDDHIYEGLEVERCGGADLYEDITVYARDTEAAWEVESPDQE
ncbi:B-cell antigen receptor complex-associated protein beta chain isoform X2 [Carassius auratus]|uniref:B-cell antigen receptor complex-associated protein beta chain isoform X2 n=1 Tax=Carassius auratus TaxID=7957 RepID=A0A6P6L2Z8_CARAU|nr:B-cell antigen receptor complex-associated protein beta chain isoform X2 [Carassius auratus]XP_052466957.1 B-cell antigen receptor complex-associated protein beta chain [Carassius gibelio]